MFYSRNAKDGKFYPAFGKMTQRKYEKDGTRCWNRETAAPLGQHENHKKINMKTHIQQWSPPIIDPKGKKSLVY